METKLIESVGEIEPGVYGNHGKFMVSRFDHEWERVCKVDEEYDGSKRALLNRVGWTNDVLLVVDL